MRIHGRRIAAAAAVALAASCAAPPIPPPHPGHDGEGHVAEAPSPAPEFGGFVRGGRRGLDEARRSGRGAMLFFAATW